MPARRSSAVLLDDRGIVLAELLADRLHLAPQDVLALLLGSALLDVLADPAAHLHLGEALALEADRQLEPLADVERLEQLDLLGEAEVGRVARGVRERAGSVIERTNAEMRPSSPRSSRISSTTARYSVSSSRIRASDSSGSGRSSTSTRRVPCASVVALPATPRWRPLSATARAPPGSRTRSVTSATTPTLA
jgi:hypothetical protein